jgi:hypothetical protein
VRKCAIAATNTPDALNGLQQEAARRKLAKGISRGEVGIFIPVCSLPLSNLCNPMLLRHLRLTGGSFVDWDCIILDFNRSVLIVLSYCNRARGPATEGPCPLDITREGGLQDVDVLAVGEMVRTLCFCSKGVVLPV